MASRALLAPFAAEVAIVTYRAVRRGASAQNPVPHLPLPATYVSAVVVFGALSLVGGEGEPVATAAGWAIVVATLLNLWQPGSASIAAGSGASSGTSSAGG